MKLELIIGNASRPVILDKQNYEGTIMEEPISNGLVIFDRVLKYGLAFSRAAGKIKDDSNCHPHRQRLSLPQR